VSRDNLDNEALQIGHRAEEPSRTSARKPVTIIDVARMANVGIGTVSRVLNNRGEVSPATAARVRQVLKRTKYRPAHAARVLARGKSDTIGLLYNTAADRLSDDPVLLSILDATQSEIQRANYHLIFTPIKIAFHETSSGLAQALNYLTADAILLVSCLMTEAALETLRGRPLVLVDSWGEDIVTSVTHNSYRSVCEAVRMLVERGHRRIAMVHRNDETRVNHREAYRGYREESDRQGLPRRPEWELASADPAVDLSRLLEEPDRPTALIMEVELAPAALQVLSAKGLKVPQDVSLSVVNSCREFAARLPGLTRSISGHYFQWNVFARVAVEEALAIIRGDDQIRHIRVPIPYRDFGTVGPAPAD